MYLDLEDQDTLMLLQPNPAQYFKLRAHNLIILDEVQSYPNIFKILRGVVDAGREEGLERGRFLVLGSASGELFGQSAQNLAGRISYREMGGLSPLEVIPRGSEGSSVALESVKKCWLRGGFPKSFAAISNSESYAWRRYQIATYLAQYMDFSGLKLGLEFSSAKMRRLWHLISLRQGGIWNVASLSCDLQTEVAVTQRHKELLEEMFLVRSLEPFVPRDAPSTALKKQFTRAPRVYVRDSGLLHALWRLSSQSLLDSHALRGSSWEGFVIESILSISHSEDIGAYFYRDRQGAEIDLILEFNFAELWAIEIKLSKNPSLGAGFYSACEYVKPKRRFLIHGPSRLHSPKVRAGKSADSHQVQVLSLVDFLKILRHRILETT